MGTKITKNLSIPIVDSQDHVAKESINDALAVIDKNALHVNHALNKSHWDYWKANTQYALHDIFRAPGIPSWGFFEVIQAGTSNTDAENYPVAYGEGDKVTNGTCELILRRLNTTDTLDFYNNTLITSDSVVARKDVPKSTSVVELHGGGKTTYPITSGNSVRIYASKFGGITELLCGYYDGGTKGQARLYYRNMSGSGADWSDWDRIAFTGDAATISAWAGGTSYNANDVVRLNNKLWVCKTANNDKSFTKAKWVQIDGYDANAPDWETKHTYSKNEVVVSEGKLYRATVNHTSTTDLKTDIANWELISGADPFIPDWETKHDYLKNEIVVSERKLYRAKANHTSTTDLKTDIANWEYVGHDPYIPDWEASHSYLKDETVVYKKTIYRALSKHTSSAAFASDVAKWEKLGGAGGVSQWTTKESYDVGQLVTNGGILYRATASHTSSTSFSQDVANWSVVTADLNHWAQSTYYPVGIIVESGDQLYKCKTAHTSTTSIAADKDKWTRVTKLPYINDWEASHDYKKDDVVISGGKMYRATANHKSTTSIDKDIANWEMLIKAPYIEDWEAKHDYLKNDIVVFNESIYRAKTAHTSTTSFLNDSANWEKLGGTGRVTAWTSKESYQVGQLVTNNGLLYKAVKDHTASADFTADIANWELVTATVNAWGTEVYYPAGIIVENNKILYKCVTAHTSTTSLSADIDNWESIKGGAPYIPDWVTKHAYKENEIIVSDSKLYRVKTAHTSTTSLSDDIANWEYVGHDPNIPDWEIKHDYKQNEVVVVNGAIARALSAHKSSSTQFSDDVANWEFVSSSSGMAKWTAKTLYQKGQLVSAWNNAYYAKSTHVSGNDFFTDYANWEFFCSHINGWVGAGYNYEPGMTVTMDGKIYSCTLKHTATSSWEDDKTANWRLIGEAALLTDWATKTSYEVGKVVVKDGSIYRANTKHTSTTFSADTDKWELLFSSIDTWKKSTYYKVGAVITVNGLIYRCNTAHTSTTAIKADMANWDIIGGGNPYAPDWATKQVYKANDIVVKDSKLYRAKLDHTAGTSFADDKDNWELIGHDKITDWEAGKKYAVADLCVYKYKMYRCKTAHTSSSTMSDTELSKYWEEVSKSQSIPPWQTKTIYNVGDIVYEDFSVYRCYKAHTSGTFIDDLVNSCWYKLDRRSVITTGIPTYSLGQELIYDSYTGLRLSRGYYKAPSTEAEHSSRYDPVCTSLVDYDYRSGYIRNHLYGETAYCGNKRVYKCSKREPIPPNTPHSIESYRITYLTTEQVFMMNKYDNDLKRYYGELVIKLPQVSDVTKVSFGRYFHKGGAVDSADISIYTSIDGKKYNLVSIFHYLMDNITAKFTAICCSYIKIRLYGVYYAGSSHSSKDGWSFSFIDVHGLSPYWTQIKDERILDYDSSKTYESQDVAVLNRKLYRCALPVDDRTGMSYDYMTKNPQWESLIADIDHWTAGTLYAKGSSVIYNHALFECLELHTASADFKTDLEDKSPKWVQISGVGTGDIATEDEVLAAMTAVITED